MVKVSKFIEHLLDLNPQRDLSRLCLYNYLKNMTNIDVQFEPSILESFYQLGLQYNYWLENQKAFGQRVESDLQHFLKKHTLDWSNQPFKHSHQMQIINLEHNDDFVGVLNNHYKELTSSTDKIKFVTLMPQQVMVLILDYNKHLTVNIHTNKATIKNGKIIPFSPITHLKYDQSLELLAKYDQVMEVTSTTKILFQCSDGYFKGTVLSTPTFQKKELIEGQLSQFSELFYSLKALERHYIQPESDPYYQEMVHLIEKTQQILQASHPDSRTVAQSVLGKAKMAIKHIFPNDKLLLLLVTNLEYSLNSGQGHTKIDLRKPVIEEKCQKISPLKTT